MGGLVGGGGGMSTKRSVREGTLLLVDGKEKKVIVGGRLRSGKTRAFLH